MPEGSPGLRRLVDMAFARRDLYRYLAGLFLARPEDASVRGILKEQNLDELAAAYGEEAVAGFRGLRVDEAAARREFDRLFRIPTEGFVPPYESVHRADEGPGPPGKPSLYGPACRAVTRLMAEAGAEPPEGIPEPPDHLGVEFLFLAFLCDEEGRAREEDDADRLARRLRQESRLLGDHLGRWFGTFAEKVRTRVPGGFYAAVVRLAGAALDTDGRRLDRYGG